MLLSLASLSFGVFCFIVHLTAAEGPLTGLDGVVSGAVGLSGALLYAFAGMLVVRFYEQLRLWANRGKERALTGKKIKAGRFLADYLVHFVTFQFLLGDHQSAFLIVSECRPGMSVPSPLRCTGLDANIPEGGFCRAAVGSWA